MLDFFKDIIHAFRQSSVERVKNPYIGAFVFSWLGFNWQTFSIIIFSKKDVMDRVEYIKTNYDVSDFILAPALTACVICVLLPLANQLFTAIQKKPIGETTKMNLDAKIEIAEKQLQIASIEAQKKLAHKKEERNIDENIESVKIALEKANVENARYNDEMIKLSSWLEKEKETVSTATKTLDSLKNVIDELNKQNNELAERLKLKEQSFEELEAENSLYEAELKRLNSVSSSNLWSFEQFSLNEANLLTKYNNIFQPNENGMLALVRPEIESRLSEFNESIKSQI